MRSFPSASRHRLATAATAGALVLGALAVPLAHADDDLKDQQRQVQKQINGAAEDLEESSKRTRQAYAAMTAAREKLDSAKAELGAVRTKLGDARLEDARMAERLATARLRLESARDELVEGQAALERQRGVVKDRIADTYMQGSPDLLVLGSLLNSSSTSDLTRQQSASSVIVGRETSMYDDLDAAEVLLQVREDDVEEAKDQVADERAAAAAHLSKVKSLTAQAVQVRDEVRGLVGKRLAARREATRAQQADRAALASLRKQEARIKARIAAAARRARGTSVSAKPSGYLQRPVGGTVTSPFGYRTHPIYGYRGLHDGTDFGVSCGQPMAAAGTGTVIAKYYSSVYGNRLFLNLGQVNGRSLTVVYNHARSYRYNVGARVSRGQTIGYVGDTGWSTGCHLHLSVLVNGTAVDPLNWM
ncbi:Murein DD-endopeptidase MepM [Nocardioides dokdonensis FR1436]|uniref:Murein DD-endopeptidase MepM n=1 Tax=Nocardioides dokdonensis FR1436 TaxID=1300347 RepID=A0A1A9GMK0_9ACTN|nr:M23 family metallopeptidase [Nocardioides dokdonensis]ANH38685.1 Murein DD-endopeptidase MepM [Nocardioides dokdonensis FR1436]